MCNCKEKLEEQLNQQFKELYPAAMKHCAELKNYAFSLGAVVKQVPFMPVELCAEHPLKKGGFKRKIIKTSFVFSYCPFCGQPLK